MDISTGKNPVMQAKVLTREKKRLLYYILLILIPSIQFAVFYFYVNINSVLLAFQKYTTKTDGTIGYLIEFALFDNLSYAWNEIISNGQMILNSMYLYLSNLIIVTCLALFFSYYIAKKYALSGLFRVMLFMPQIISQVSLAYLFTQVCNGFFPDFVRAIGGEEWLIANKLNNGLLGGTAPETENIKFIAILFYNIWIGFGANVMLYTGSMSAIDQSIIESAQLDGVGFFSEFVYIYFPLTWSTFTTFVVTGLTAIFTSTMGLTTFAVTAGNNVITENSQVFGYYLYNATRHAVLVADGGLTSYSQVSAIGIIITLVLVPITLGLRKVMETFGPRTDK